MGTVRRRDDYPEHAFRSSGPASAASAPKSSTFGTPDQPPCPTGSDTPSSQTTTETDYSQPMEGIEDGITCPSAANKLAVPSSVQGPARQTSRGDVKQLKVEAPLTDPEVRSETAQDDAKPRLEQSPSGMKAQGKLAHKEASSVDPEIGRETGRDDAKPRLEETARVLEAQEKTAHKKEASQNAQDNIIKRFKPSQYLYKTPILLEYGPGDGENRTVHLERLCCYSTLVADNFRKAEPMRQQHEASRKIWNHLKSVLAKELSSESFVDKTNISLAIKLVRHCFLQYPLLTYQTHVQDELIEFSDDYLFNNNKKLTDQGSKVARQVGFKDLGFLDKIGYLNSTGVKMLTMHLCMVLRDIKLGDIDPVRNCPIEAAARGRILVHGTDVHAVESLVGWVYEKNLHIIDTQHLCRIYTVADKLGIVDLAKTCANRLHSDAWAAMHEAKVRGLPLESLLGPVSNGNRGSNDGRANHKVVRAVFSFVLGQKNPPAVLEKLVVEALSQNMKAFEMLESQVTREVAIKILKASHKREH